MCSAGYTLRWSWASALSSCRILYCSIVLHSIVLCTVLDSTVLSLFFSVPQLRELLLKYWLVYWRTPSYTLARCALTLAVALIYGSMYYKAAVLPKPYASMGNVQNIMGIMFSSTSFLGMTNLMAVMPLVGESRAGVSSNA